MGYRSHQGRLDDCYRGKLTTEVNSPNFLKLQEAFHGCLNTEYGLCVGMEMFVRGDDTGYATFTFIVDDERAPDTDTSKYLLVPAEGDIDEDEGMTKREIRDMLETELSNNRS